MSKTNIVEKIPFIKNNFRAIVESGILLFSIVLPLFINTSALFKDYLEKNELSPENFIPYVAAKHGGVLASIALFAFVLYIIRKCNSDYVMNNRGAYHDYPYYWYFYCAKILGIRKCNLVLVPIYLQFQLVINGVFDEYPLNENEYPAKEEELESTVTKRNTGESLNEINLILEDTYPIKMKQLPKNKRQLFTIKVSRNEGIVNGRHFSQKFIEATFNAVKSIRGRAAVNVFATTNPMNTLHISKRVFVTGNRANIDHLYVYQQRHDGIRRFSAKAHKIY